MHGIQGFKTQRFLDDFMTCFQQHNWYITVTKLFWNVTKTDNKRRTNVLRIQHNRFCKEQN